MAGNPQAAIAVKAIFSLTQEERELRSKPLDSVDAVLERCFLWRRYLDSSNSSRYWEASHGPEILETLWEAMRRLDNESVPLPSAPELIRLNPAERGKFLYAYWTTDNPDTLHPEAVLHEIDKVVQWVKDMRSATETETEAPTEAPKANRKPSLTRKQAASRMLELRHLGLPWTSYHKMANQLHGSSGTIHGAIKDTPALHEWADYHPATERRDRPVTEGEATSTDMNPENEAAIREFLERDLESDVRAWFNGLSAENQILYLEKNAS